MYHLILEFGGTSDASEVIRAGHRQMESLYSLILWRSASGVAAIQDETLHPLSTLAYRTKAERKCSSSSL